MSARGPRTAWLPCPACDEDAIESTGYGCRRGCAENGVSAEECGDEHGSEPLWSDGDDGTCPTCGVRLRVLVDDEHAYVEMEA